MGALSKADLLRVRTTVIALPEGTITIRPLTAAYAVGLRGRSLGDADIFEILARSICDDAGELILTAEDVGQMPIARLQPILDGVMQFNSLSEGKAAEDLKKIPA